mgnify:CR=1 FL=1
MNDVLLKVNNLKTWFSSSKGPVRAVDGVSFSVGRGETFALVGATKVVVTGDAANKPVAAASAVRLVSRPKTISALLLPPSSLSLASNATPSSSATKSRRQAQSFSKASLTLGPGPHSATKES